MLPSLNVPPSYTDADKAYIYGYLMKALSLCIKGNDDGSDNKNCVVYYTCKANSYFTLHPKADFIQEGLTTEMLPSQLKLMEECIAHNKVQD